MAGKKKKPTFNIPDDIPAASQAGWVYRTEPEPAPEAPRRPSRDYTKPVWMPFAVFFLLIMALFPGKRRN